MAVAPVHSKLNGSALVVVLNRPVVVHGLQTSHEEIIVTRLHHQCNRITSKNVFLTDRPCPPFNVDLVSM